jgi:hypothetical protein
MTVTKSSSQLLGPVNITGNAVITGNLVVNGNITQGDETADILTVAGYIQGSAAGSTYLRIGNSSTSHGLAATSDLCVLGKLEVDGTAFFDGAVNFSSTVTPATNDLTALGSGALSFSDLFLASGGVINFNNGNVAITHSTDTLTFQFGKNYVVSQQAAISGSPTAFTVTGGAHTGLTASTEDIGAYFNLSATKTWATTLPDLQREFVVKAPTYACSVADTMDICGTFNIEGPPSPGTNATISNALGLVIGNPSSGTTSSVDNVIMCAAIMPGITNGTGAVTGRAGLLITGANGSAVALGDQTATLTSFYGISVDAFSLSSTTLTRTVTNAAAIYVNGAPASGGNVTFTNGPYSIFVDAGLTRLDGGAVFGAAASPLASDGAALGSSSLMWSDLFLASGAVINFNNGDVTLIHSADTLTLGGGNFALGSNSITMTGSLAATGARVTKGWFTDIESTNAPTIGGVAATGSGGLVLATSPTLVTPVLGVAAATSINFGGSTLSNYTAVSTWIPTPTLSGGAGNTVGTGTITAFYSRIGSIVEFELTLVTDNSTAYAGTGRITFTLPVTASASNTTGYVGSLYIFDGSTEYVGFWDLPSTTTISCYKLSAGSVSAVTGNNLAGNNRQVRIWGRYFA